MQEPLLGQAREVSCERALLALKALWKDSSPASHHYKSVNKTRSCNRVLQCYFETPTKGPHECLVEARAPMKARPGWRSAHRRMEHKLMPCKSNAHFVRNEGCGIISSLLMTHDDKRSLLPRPSPGSRIWAHDVVARTLPAPHRLRSSHRQPAPGVDRSSCKDSRRCRRRRFILPSSRQPQVYNSATTMTATTCGSKRN